MQPSYSGIASNSVPSPRNMNFLELKIIPPINNDYFATKNTFEGNSNQCISAILRQFSPEQRTKITLSKTFTIVGTQRLHTFHLVAPTEATNSIERLQSTGIELLGRTVFPQSDSFERFMPGMNPKYVPIRILQLPSICQDEELPEILELTESTQITSVRHNTEEIDGMIFQNGKVSTMICVVSKEHEETLRQWSIRNHENGTLQWHDIPFYAFIPALHQCQLCKDNRRHFYGHDNAWCRHAKEEMQLRTTTPPNNRNQDVSVPPSNQATIQEVSTPTTEETNENNMTQEGNSYNNQNNNENQVNIETDSETDDDHQNPWQTASTHRKKNNMRNQVTISTSRFQTHQEESWQQQSKTFHSEKPFATDACNQEGETHKRIFFLFCFVMNVFYWIVEVWKAINVFKQLLINVYKNAQTSTIFAFACKKLRLLIWLTTI